MDNSLDISSLAANVGPADLMAVLSKYPVFFGVLLGIFIAVCVGYLIVWLIRKNKIVEKPAEKQQ